VGRDVLQVLGRSAGGIAAHVRDVVEGLDGTGGLTVSVAGPTDLPVQMPAPVLPLEIPAGAIRGHRRAVLRLREILAAAPYRVVHAHGLRAGIDAAVAARPARIPVIATVHNLVRPEISGRVRGVLLARAEPLVVRLCARVFAPSEEIARHLRAASPKHSHKVEVLYLSPGEPRAPARDRSAVRDELRMREGDRLIVSVARLHPQKDLGTALRALARLDTRSILAIVGDGPRDEELRRTARELGVQDRVRFLGYRSDATDYVAAADVFCLSSVWEARALAAQEAILLGVPVVSTDVGGMSELIEDGVSGRLVPKGDDGAFAAALAELLDSPALRTRLAQSARRDLANRASREDMLLRLRRTYEELG
jgi:glycosyltransferase involved in cell wall biosynthesis